VNLELNITSNVIFEIYRHIGEKLRDAFNKIKNIPEDKRHFIYEKLDKAKTVFKEEG